MRARSAAVLQMRADAKVGAAEAGRRARRRSGAFRPGKILPSVRSALYSFGLLKWGICRFGRVGGRADRKYGLTVEPFLGQIRSYSPDAKAACENADRVAVTTYSSLFNTNPFFDDPEVIVVDDAHASENYIADLWTVRIRRFEEKDETLFKAVAGVLKQVVSETNYARMTGESRSL